MDGMAVRDVGAQRAAHMRMRVRMYACDMAAHAMHVRLAYCQLSRPNARLALVGRATRFHNNYAWVRDHTGRIA